MADPAQLAVIEPMEGTAETPVREVKLQDFAPSVTVHGPRNSRFEVAINAAANRAHWQIILSKIDWLLEKKLALMKKKAEANEEDLPDALTLNRIVTTAAALQGMSILAYGDGTPPSDPPGSDFERFAVSAVKAATEGAVKGMGSFKDKEARIRELGRKKEEKTVTPIESAPMEAK
jgi:hypothetical protein